MKKFELTKENIGKGYLILINPDYLLQKNQPVLVPFDDEFKEIELEKCANEKLHLALSEIEAGKRIVPVSGYRSLEEQIDIYDTSVKENGEEFTKKFVALPNASEHQTGLAIDLALNEGEIDFICPSFPYHGICQEFRSVAPNYGFIERYQEEKKEITKISKEEWHFRYVGFPHSKIITDHDFCLEEYLNYLKDFIYPSNPLKIDGYEIFYLPYQNEEDSIEVENDSIISGNNVDGFILTRRVENE